MKFRRADLLLLLAACFLLFWSLGDRGLWGSEGRWAEVTREMFLSGDFFHPTIGGEPYFDKPLLTYWLIAGVSALTGVLNEFVIRLPSAIAGMIGIGATVFLGRRLWSAQVGTMAGWILLTSYGFLFWSRTAAADTENLAAIIMAVAWYWARRDRPNYLTFQVFYLMIFLGALTKGLVSVAVPVLVLLPDLLREKRWKLFRKPSHIIALVIALLIYFFPFLYASLTRPEEYQSSGLALVFQENIQRFVMPIDHKEPFYIYLYSVPMLLLPWIPLFIAALAGMLSTWKDLDKKTRWLLMAIAIIFALFTLSGSRRNYYILPIMPFCALLIAVFVVFIRSDRIKTIQQGGMAIQTYLILGLVLVELCIPIVLLVLKATQGFIAPMSLSVISVVIGLVGLLALVVAHKAKAKIGIRWENKHTISIHLIIATLTFGGYFCGQYNILDRFRTERPFAQALRMRTLDLASERIGIFPKTNAELLYYLDTQKPLKVLKTASDWQYFLEDSRTGIIIGQQRYVSNIPSEYSGFLETKPVLIEEAKAWESSSSHSKKWVAWFLNKSVPENRETTVKENTKDAN